MNISCVTTYTQHWICYLGSKVREKERLKKKRETEKSVCTSSFVYIFQKSPVKDKMVRNRAGRQEPHRSSAAQNSKASRNFFFF